MLRDENSQSSMVMVLLFRAANLGFRPFLNCRRGEREAGSPGGQGEGER